MAVFIDGSAFHCATDATEKPIPDRSKKKNRFMISNICINTVKVI
jgi:hypothetical protein